MLAVIAAVFYANANIIGRRWHDLFKEELESQSLRTLSFAASAFAVCAMYALVGDNAVAIVLALFVFALCVLGKQFSIWRSDVSGTLDRSGSFCPGHHYRTNAGNLMAWRAWPRSHVCSCCRAALCELAFRAAFGNFE